MGEEKLENYLTGALLYLPGVLHDKWGCVVTRILVDATTLSKYPKTFQEFGGDVLGYNLETFPEDGEDEAALQYSANDVLLGWKYTVPIETVWTDFLFCAVFDVSDLEGLRNYPKEDVASYFWKHFRLAFRVGDGVWNPVPTADYLPVIRNEGTALGEVDTFGYYRPEYHKFMMREERMQMERVMSALLGSLTRNAMPVVDYKTARMLMYQARDTFFRLEDKIGCVNGMFVSSFSTYLSFRETHILVSLDGSNPEIDVPTVRLSLPEYLEFAPADYLYLDKNANFCSRGVRVYEPYMMWRDGGVLQPGAAQEVVDKRESELVHRIVGEILDDEILSHSAWYGLDQAVSAPRFLRAEPKDDTLSRFGDWHGARVLPRGLADSFDVVELRYDEFVPDLRTDSGVECMNKLAAEFGVKLNMSPSNSAAIRNANMLWFLRNLLRGNLNHGKPAS